MNNSLLNNYAIVCGSTQGIGLCVAQNLAKKGFNLIKISSVLLGYVKRILQLFTLH